MSPPLDLPPGADRPRPAMRPLTVAAGLVLAAVLLAAGVIIGAATVHPGDRAASAPDRESRDFMFQVLDLPVRNQGGHTANLYFHYRYDQGIADKDIPNYLDLRRMAVHYLDTVDVSRSPYWEVLNHRLCTQLKNGFPVEAISCELQIVGTETPAPHDEPGYRASVETIGDIDPLAIPGPSTHP